ncbi:PAS domain S-box protein [Haliangium sp.]|uniref:PAS domain-containing sensor histidine kinase n=1 Tax=Haliangium sp. TaxID=2663208 RepID=UPI003D150DB5
MAAAFRSVADAVVIIDSADRIVDLNPAAEELFARTSDACRGVPLDSLVNLSGGVPDVPVDVPTRVQALPPDTRGHLLTGTFTRLPGADGEAGGGVLALTPTPPADHGSWQRLVSDSGGLYCVVGVDGHFLEVGERWTHVLGYPPGELLGRLFFDYLHPDDVDPSRAQALLMINDNARTVSFENRYRCQDGSYRWLSWYAISDRERRRTLAFATDLTDLRRQERLLRETQIAARVGGWELDVARGLMYWTEENFRIHETSPEEYTPTVEGSLSYYTEDSAPIINEAVRRAIEHGEPFDLELEMVTARGRRIWCRDVAHVIEEDGRAARVYGSCQDITEQRRYREALRESEERLRTLIRDVRVGVLVHGPDGQVVQCNQAALDVLGLTREQLMSDDPLGGEHNLIHEDGRPFTFDEYPVLHAIRTRRSVTGINMGLYRARHDDWVWLLMHAVVQVDDRGAVKSVVCSFADITARKRAEDAARDSHAMFQAVYENAGLGVILRGIDGRLIDCNPTFERMIGHSADILRELAVERYVYHDDIAAPAKRHRALLAGERSSYEVDRRYLSADGDILWGHVTVSVVGDGDGAPRHLVEMIMDITDRKRMEAQLMLTDRLASLGTMAAGVAHEINNPLTWLMGNITYVVETLTELRHQIGLDPDDYDGLFRSLEDSLAGAERIRTIVQDLRLFARTRPSHDATADITRVVQSTLRMLHNQIMHRARCELEISDELPVVLGDEARLGQVMTNLVVNAVQAMPDGRSQDNLLRIRVVPEGEYVVIAVADNGVGIPAEVQTHIFDPFFTTKSVGEGTGLGLSICHSIVAELGGGIELKSEVGRGTTFTVRLRVAPAARGSSRRLTTRPPLANPAQGGEGKQILCIDDEPDMGEALHLMLGKHHELTFETSGHRALARLRAGERYDVVLCDLMMPGMSGMDFYQALSDLDPELAERCAFMTGGSFTPAARSFAENLPSTRLLEKPFVGDSVRALVERLTR